MVNSGNSEGDASNPEGGPGADGTDPDSSADPATSPAHMWFTIFDAPVLNVVARALFWVLLKCIGWREGGSRPTAPKFVLIAAPHTSNWDFLLLIAFAFRFHVKLYWMGKESIFKGWRSPVVKFLGGIPIDRSKKNGMVAQTIETFENADRLAITIPAEGTRGKSEAWKSGFYHIAHGAKVPVILGFLDYDKKVGGFGPELLLTGDIDADMAIIADFYADIGAKYPEKKTPPRLI